ncbi:hypothetical protein [Rhizobium leguminosarum]|uniref:hypothetical protein n=1 Tax=Rhizobium leguminosarum TaxID=384 RepID=UPI002E14B39E|nr:hypothetical protein U8Q02_43875 [Rhizobium leguminosarum]
MSDDNQTMDRYWEVSQALQGLGLQPIGNSHSEDFLVGVAEIAARAIRELEEFVDGEMPDDVKDIFHVVAERAASKAGPQITVTYG